MKINKMKIVVVFVMLALLSWRSVSSNITFAQLPSASVSVYPETQTAVVNGSSSVDIRIGNAQDMGGFQLGVVYDSNKLELTSLVIKTNSGDFLGSTGRTVLPIGPVPTVADAAGDITFGAFSFGVNPGPDSTAANPGTLATLTFIALQPGVHTIQLQEVIVSTSDFPPDQQPVVANNGSIEVSGDVSATPTPGPSATPQPSVSPAPTASPEPSATPASTPPTGGTVILQIRLQGVVSMPTTGDDDRFVRVAVKQGDATVTTQNVRMRRTQGTIGGISLVYYTNAVTDPNKLINLSPGTYDFYVSGPVHLTKKFNAEVVDTEVNTLSFVSVRLPAGDIRDDNVVDETDYNRMVENFGCISGQNPPPGKTCPPAGASIPADLDFDGEVGVLDFAYFIGNYSYSGD